MSTRLVLRQGGQGEACVEECAVPQLAEDEALIHVQVVAVNPIDWKMMYRQTISELPVLGCDFAGQIGALGIGVKGFLIGERVAGLTQGGNVESPEDGAFAQYITVPAHVLIRLPPDMSSEQGAALPTAVMTAGFCLYKQLSLPFPHESEAGKVSGNAGHPAILIYGAATSIGSMQVQLGNLSGLRVIAVCSRDSFDYVQRCGAESVFDYRDPSCGEQLARAAGSDLIAAVDCISDESSASLCEAAMASSGDIYISCTAKGPAVQNKRVRTVRIVAFTMIGRNFSFGPGSPVTSVIHGDVEFARRWVPAAERLLAMGLIRGTEPDVRSGGLHCLHQGIQELKDIGVRRKKLVYRIE